LIALLRTLLRCLVDRGGIGVRGCVVDCGRDVAGLRRGGLGDALGNGCSLRRNHSRDGARYGRRAVRHGLGDRCGNLWSRIINCTSHGCRDLRCGTRHRAGHGGGDLRCGAGHRTGHGGGDLGCGARRHLRDSRCDLRGEGGGLALRNCGCGCRCDFRCGIGNKRGGRSSSRCCRLGCLRSNLFDCLDNSFLPLLGGLLDGFLLLCRELARSGGLGLRRAFEGIGRNILRQALRIVLRLLHVLVRVVWRRAEVTLRREACALAGTQA